MTENVRDKLHQEECKQSKRTKIYASIRREREGEKFSKLSAKYLQDKICKIKQIQNIPLTLRTFLNQLKRF